jgi:hypothetical protein
MLTRILFDFDSSFRGSLASCAFLALFAIVILMSTVFAESIAAGQTLPAPQAITDPKQIASKPNAQVEPKSLTIEKLYMTRQVGRADVVAGRQEHRLHFEHERTQQSVAGFRRRGMAGAAHGQRPAPDMRPRGRPTANGSPINPITTAMSCGIFFWSRQRPAKS